MNKLESEVVELKNDFLKGKEPSGFKRLPYPSGDELSISTNPENP